MEWLICLTHGERANRRSDGGSWICLRFPDIYDGSVRACVVVSRLLVDPEGPSITITDPTIPGVLAIGRLINDSDDWADAIGCMPDGRYVRTDETGDK